MKRATLHLKREPLVKKALHLQPDVLPDWFFDRFVERLWVEHGLHAPVTLRRLLPFIITYIHSSMMESMLTEGQRLGLFNVETKYSHHQGPKVPPESFRVLVPLISGSSQK